MDNVENYGLLLQERRFVDEKWLRNICDIMWWWWSQTEMCNYGEMIRKIATQQKLEGKLNMWQIAKEKHVQRETFRCVFIKSQTRSSKRMLAEKKMGW